MKRNSLTTALLAGLAGAAGLATTATAVNLNPDGLGQVLIYPYYTVNAGNDTLLSVVNTTNRAKAVKVRFLEGRNSREVLDFNLYLSPFDVWTAAVFQLSATGPANLLTRDTSCTVPAIRTNATLAQTAAGDRYIDFRNFQYTGTNADNGPTGITRTREGYFEMIEMGVLQTGPASTELEDEATHVAPADVPLNCGALEAAWTPPSGGWVVNGAADIDLPSGGLFGGAELVDVANGTLLGYNAEAIEGFYTDATAPGALHAQPGSVLPSLQNADNGAVATSFVFTSTGQVVSSNWTIGTADAVSAIFMHDAIYNEYNTESTIGAQSEWVVTFPTKRFYVDVTADSLVRDPFNEAFRDEASPNGSACEEVTVTYWNREENTTGAAPGVIDFSPPPPVGAPTVPALCWEANVISFNQAAVGTGGATAILGGTYGFNINTVDLPGSNVFANGWMRLVFDDPLTAGVDHTYTSLDGDIYTGLPAIGFWAANYVNSAAQPGLLANYAGIHRHRASRVITLGPP